MQRGGGYHLSIPLVLTSDPLQVGKKTKGICFEREVRKMETKLKEMARDFEVLIAGTTDEWFRTELLKSYRLIQEGRAN